MKVYRCRICGETYLGEEAPDKCPFCGAAECYLVDGANWIDENENLKLTETSKKNIEAAIQLEVGNSRFYLCAAAAAKGTDNEVEGMFKQLAKVEREHASLLSKMLGTKMPEEIFEPLECFEKGIDNVEESAKREENAVAHYSKFLSEATEERAQVVFGALVEIEKTHIELDKSEKEKLSV